MAATASPQPLRIAFVMLHTSPLDVPGTKDAGGMNVVVREQAAELARAGHDVRIYTRRADPNAPAQVLLPSGVRVLHLDAGPAQLLPKGAHEELMPAFAAALTAALRQEPCDILHGEHWFSGLAALPAAHEFGVPLVQSFHSIAAPANTPLAAGERAESPGRLAGEARLAREVAQIITVSEAEKQTVLERLGGALERVRVVHLGVDTALFHPLDTAEEDAARDWTSCGGRPEAIVVGRMHPLKGFDLAVRALAAIPAAKRPCLRVIGAPPPDGDAYARSLHEAVAEAGMLGTTAFDGALKRAELAERIRRAAVLLVPSHSETFGLVALEAAACGVPVIARAAGGLCEAVRDGVTGVLLATEPGSAEETAAWRDAILRLCGDAVVRRSMGDAARKWAESRSWAASARELERCYREVLGSF